MTEEQPLLADEACEDHTVMFLCTNNYHRSRFAEMLFNALAKEANLDWTACSRGLIVRFSPSSADPISIRALEGLAVRRISSQRWPMISGACSFSTSGRTPTELRSPK